MELQKCIPDQNSNDGKQITVAFEALDELVTLTDKFKISDEITAEKIREVDPNNAGFRSMISVSKRVRASATTLSSQHKLKTTMLEDMLNDATTYLQKSKLAMWGNAVVRATSVAQTQVVFKDYSVTLQAFRRGGTEEHNTWWGTTTTKATFKTVKAKAESSCLQLGPKDLTARIDELKRVHNEFIEISDIFNDGFRLRL